MQGRSMYDASRPLNVIDFTEYKVLDLIDKMAKANREDMAYALEEALALYYKGELAFEWIAGHPVAVVPNQDVGGYLRGLGGSVDHWDSKEEIGQEDENENPNDYE